MKNKSDLISQNKVFLWIAAAPLAVLSIPFIAMQFSTDVDWGTEDFVVIGILLFGAGSIFVVIARLIDKKYRLLAGIITILAILWIWAELAVGIFTNIGS